MERPIVNRIETQQEEIKTNTDVSQSEINQLLSKYGYSREYTKPIQNSNSNRDLTFEEMIRKEEESQKELREYRDRIRKDINPRTFNNKDVYYSEEKYTNIDLGNGQEFGIKINITSDRKIR